MVLVNLLLMKDTIRFNSKDVIEREKMKAAAE